MQDLTKDAVCLMWQQPMSGNHYLFGGFGTLNGSLCAQSLPWHWGLLNAQQHFVPVLELAGP